MSERQSPSSHFLTAPVSRIFASTSFPMVVIMGTNGMLGVIDAAFLGHFVGANAMAAVGIAFPVLMLTIALSTLVSSGMSSLLARQLGAGARELAGSTIAGAHGLAMAMAITLILFFLVAGSGLATIFAGTDGSIAEMIWAFLAVTIFGTPIQFLLGIHADAWRNEGKAGRMAILSLGVTVINIGLNYLLIVILELGVAGSALGTVLAQASGLLLLIVARQRMTDMIPLASIWRHRWNTGWAEIAILGAPLSLGFIGMALSATSVVLALRLAMNGYDVTAAAYGIVTRIFGFAFLPLMAIAMAMQTLVGHNVGARLYGRSNAALRVALFVALAYGATVEAVLQTQHVLVAMMFVSDAKVVGEVGRLLQPMSLLYLTSGPVLILGFYFQAIGKVAPAAILTLAKPFVLLPALIATIAMTSGADAIWFAYPMADGLTAVVAGILLATAVMRKGVSGGIGVSAKEELSWR